MGESITNHVLHGVLGNEITASILGQTGDPSDFDVNRTYTPRSSAVAFSEGGTSTA